VSQINGPTCRVNELVDKLLFVAEKLIPFHSQDTTAYLQLLDKYKACDSSTFLVTMDVASLYTNIPHDEGADFVCQFYEETLDAWQLYNLNIDSLDKETVRELIMFILHNCTFEFNHVFFKQNFGTTMGAKFSVKFVNIYMHMWFRTYLSRYTGVKPDFIARLIDDCSFKRSHSETELLAFFPYINSCHSSIKFKFNIIKIKLPF
jgi:formylmethanofuran dehydrogenase subunit E-like metal-binding protein